MSIGGRFSQFRDRLAGRRPSPDAARSEAGTEAGPGRPVLVVGLGNPGAQYGNTRHNVGAWCINLLARRHGVDLQRHGSVDSARIEIDGRRVDIARPRAMMNVCGPPIAAEAKRLGARPEQVLVIYDDLDLPTGRARMRLQGGSGGNNGMKSIIAALGGGEFARIRIGIDRPYDGDRPVREPDRIADWVLSTPRPEEREQLNVAVERVADAVERAVVDSLDAAMNALNREPDPAANPDRAQP